MGESILFSKLAELALGVEPEGYDTLLHPMAYAGWAGLFVTALNLLPIGQLDGGHVIYSLFGYQKSREIYKLTLAAFMIVCAIWYIGWILLIVLLLLFGLKHPPSLNDYIGLDLKRKLIACLTLAIFVISFIPVPFHIF
jgi:membrane-associated protease RseP (regulator of RpoE activity)